MEQLLVNIARGLVEDKDAVKVTADEKNAESINSKIRIINCVTTLGSTYLSTPL